MQRLEVRLVLRLLSHFLVPGSWPQSYCFIVKQASMGLELWTRGAWQGWYKQRDNRHVPSLGVPVLPTTILRLPYSLAGRRALDLHHVSSLAPLVVKQPSLTKFQLVR